MSKTEVQGTAAGLLAIARVHRRRAKTFRALSAAWENSPMYAFVPRGRRKVRARGYRALAQGEITAAKELEALAKKAKGAWYCFLCYCNRSEALLK